MAIEMDRSMMTLSGREVLEQPSASTLHETATLTRRSVVSIRELSVEESSAATLTPTTSGYANLARQLAELAQLGYGWDGFGAPPIAPMAVATARSLLESSRQGQLIPPSVAPTVRGGVQLEWYLDGWELHLETEPDGDYFVFYSNPVSGETWEGRLDGAPVAGLSAVIARFARQQ